MVRTQAREDAAKVDAARAEAADREQVRESGFGRQEQKRY